MRPIKYVGVFPQKILDLRHVGTRSSIKMVASNMEPLIFNQSYIFSVSQISILYILLLLLDSLAPCSVPSASRLQIFDSFLCLSLYIAKSNFWKLSMRHATKKQITSPSQLIPFYLPDLLLHIDITIVNYIYCTYTALFFVPTTRFHLQRKK